MLNSGDFVQWRTHLIKQQARLALTVTRHINQWNTAVASAIRQATDIVSTADTHEWTEATRNAKHQVTTTGRQTIWIQLIASNDPEWHSITLTWTLASNWSIRLDERYDCASDISSVAEMCRHLIRVFMIRNDNYRKLSRILSICDTDKLVRIQNGSTRGCKQDSGFSRVNTIARTS